MGEDRRGRLIGVQRVAQSRGHAEKALRPLGVDGDSGQGLDLRAIKTLPADLALVASRETAFIQGEMNRPDEAETLQHLRQQGAEAKTPPAEDRRTLPKVAPW